MPSDTSEYADKSIPVSLIVGIMLVLCAAAGGGYIGYSFAAAFELFGGVSVVLATVRLANVLLGSFLITAGVLLSFAVGYSFAAPAGLSFWLGVCLYLILIPLFLISRMNAAPTPEGSEEELAALKAALTSDFTLVLILTLGVVCAAILFLNMLNDLAYSSITREGDMFSVMKQLPLSLCEQVRAKRNVARNIVGISTVGYLTIAVLVGIILGVLPWYVLPYSLSVGLPLLCLVVDIDMISGIRHSGAILRSRRPKSQYLCSQPLRARPDRNATAQTSTR